MLGFALVVLVLCVAVLFVGIKIIPQTDIAIVERLGRFHRVLDGGFHFIIPVIDRVSAVVSAREQIIDIGRGLVDRVAAGHYKIQHDLDTSHMQMENNMKNTLSALYDIFGDNAFSVEMVIAKLDYSSSYVSSNVFKAGNLFRFLLFNRY